MTAAVERLEQPEYGHIWDRFQQRFQFRPGMSYSTWPAITEPADSTTWSRSALDDDPGYLKLDTVVDAVNNGLRACTTPEGTLLVLDWNHSCYRIKPHAISAEDGPAWPDSMMPDGDYNIHLAEDFSYGTFGHPWE